MLFKMKHKRTSPIKMKKSCTRSFKREHATRDSTRNSMQKIRRFGKSTGTQETRLYSLFLVFNSISNTLTCLKTVTFLLYGFFRIFHGKNDIGKDYIL